MLTDQITQPNLSSLTKRNPPLNAVRTTTTHQNTPEPHRSENRLSNQKTNLNHQPLYQKYPPTLATLSKLPPQLRQCRFMQSLPTTQRQTNFIAILPSPPPPPHKKPTKIKNQFPIPKLPPSQPSKLYNNLHSHPQRALLRTIRTLQSTRTPALRESLQTLLRDDVAAG